MSRLLVVLCLCFIVSKAAAQNSKAVDEGELLILPVHVHLFSSDLVPQLHSQANEEQVYNWFIKVNSLWHQANIQWKVVKIDRVSTSTSMEFQFGQLIRQSRTGPITYEQKTFEHLIKKMCQLSPEEAGSLWHVYVAEDLGRFFAGIYINNPQRILIGQRGPSGEHPAEVLAHEFGHSLSLKHKPPKENTNIMTQVRKAEGHLELQFLNTEQIQRARKQAIKGHGYTLNEQQAEVFHRRDLSNNNCLETEELRPKAQKDMAKLDHDGSGCIELNEYLKRWSSPPPTASESTKAKASSP